MGVGTQNLGVWPPVTASSAIRNHISSLHRKRPRYRAAKHQQSLFLAQPLLAVSSQRRPTAGSTTIPRPSELCNNQTTAEQPPNAQVLEEQAGKGREQPLHVLTAALKSSLCPV